MALFKSLPDGFYREPITIREAFCKVGIPLGDTKEKAEDLFSILPRELKIAPAFFLVLINKWCYEFGEVFDRMPRNHILLGSEQFPQIEYLYLGLRAADKYLSRVQLLSFLQRLAHPAKHLIALGELTPLVRISKTVTPTYEVEGYGNGNRSIDWLFEPKEGVPILMDVKYRIVDLLQHMNQMIPEIDDGKSALSTPEIDPESLFKDTIEKFIPRSTKIYLQGVWIHSHIKQEKAKLQSCFNNLDPQRLHFAIMSRWEGNAYILCRDEVDIEYLYKFFDLTPKNEFVY
ncbi:MAG: hypothetical protein ABSC53_14520 [Bacteroidota bacterium]